MEGVKPKRKIENEDEPKGVVADITAHLSNFFFHVMCSASFIFGISVGIALWGKFRLKIIHAFTLLYKRS